MGVFSGKTVLVVGAGRGAGRAIARMFARQGAQVAANDVTPVNLDETVALIRQEGGQVRDYIEDIARKMPVQTMVEQALADFGQIDILVNCAAVAPRAALLDMDEWDWHRTIDVNLGGGFLLLQVVGRVMRQQGGGIVINLVSPGIARSAAAFSASQAGMLALTQAAARELAGDDIRVHAICLPKTQLAADCSPQVIESVLAAVVALCDPLDAARTGQVVQVGETAS